MRQSRNTPLALCVLVIGAVGFGNVPELQAAAKSGRQSESGIASADAEIAELRRRLRALEERVGSAAPAPEPRATASERARERSMRGLQTPEAEAAYEEEALARALERSLVLSGGVLLPKGSFELTPALRYDYTRRSGLALVPPGAIASRDVRRDNYVASLGFKAGLPWQSQLELTVPYGHQRIESVTAATPVGTSESGVGDVQIGVSKQLLFESRRRPGLIANLAWQESTGRSALTRAASLPGPAGVPVPSLGLGYDALTTTLTAVKRLDPLVFTGSVSHAFNQSTDSAGTAIEPGDTTGAGLRAILAASPDVSLRGGFSLARTRNTKVNGLVVPGSTQTAALLELGGSVALSKRTLLDLTLAAGLTQDAPDFLVGIALPVRF